jgi:putative transcriptional regulator
VAILNRIRMERIENDNMSQAQLAREIEVSRQTLNAVERGRRVPSLEVAYRIAVALECDLDDVFHYESEYPAKDDGDDDGVRRMSIRVCLDHDPEWWKSDDVSRVTTRA